MSLEEALGGGVFAAEADGSGGNVDELRGAGAAVGAVALVAGGGLDHAEAGELGAAVDSEDTHGGQSIVRLAAGLKREEPRLYPPPP